jgi:hypothetical protein
MKLSNKTYLNLAKALQDEVADYIRQDDRYIEFMMELVSDAIQSKLGTVHDEILMDLSLLSNRQIRYFSNQNLSLTKYSQGHF